MVGTKELFTINQLFGFVQSSSSSHGYWKFSFLRESLIFQRFFFVFLEFFFFIKIFLSVLVVGGAIHNEDWGVTHLRTRRTLLMKTRRTSSFLGLFGCCFQELFSVTENKKHWKRAWERGWFCFWCFLCSREASFQRTKKSCFGCFLHCSRLSCSSCFLLLVFCVSLHAASPSAARNRGWRWQPWLWWSWREWMVVGVKGVSNHAVLWRARPQVDMSWATNFEILKSQFQIINLVRHED